MQTERGSTFTWTIYNAVASITQDAFSTFFTYGPNRNCTKQVATYVNGTSATLYVGGILERVTNTGVDDYRHLIRTGGATIIVARASNGSNITYYATQDHLGSSAATTNSSGGVTDIRHLIDVGGASVIVSRANDGANAIYYKTEDHLGSSSAVTNGAGVTILNSSFDAFGARRGANWQGAPSTGDWQAIASTTRHGFTDHNMLDNLGLIHMNGRVYDSVIGRFQSADPTIPDLYDSQALNPYSYVNNNPLRYTDPSGYVAGAPGWKSIQIDPNSPPLEEILVTSGRGSSNSGSNFVSPFPNNLPGPSGSQEGSGGGGTTSEPMEEVVVSAPRLQPPSIKITLSWVSPAIPQFGVSQDLFAGIDRAYAEYSDCMNSCMQGKAQSISRGAMGMQGLVTGLVAGRGNPRVALVGMAAGGMLGNSIGRYHPDTLDSIRAFVSGGMSGLRNAATGGSPLGPIISGTTSAIGTSSGLSPEVAAVLGGILGGAMVPGGGGRGPGALRGGSAAAMGIVARDWWRGVLTDMSQTACDRTCSK